MRFFRLAWVVMAVVVLGLDAAGVPHVYADYRDVCTRDTEVCLEEGLLVPDSVRQLERLGLSPGFYAAYVGVGLQSIFTLVCFAVAAVIFLRRSEDRMALFTSFVLLIFGGVVAAGTMQELAEARPSLWLPVTLAEYVSQVCFVIFFLLFPDGRFRPRWTLWIAAAAAVYFVPDVFLSDSALALLLNPVFFALLGGVVIVQIYRYRLVSASEQRQQTKWVVFGLTVALAGFSTVVAAMPVFLPPLLVTSPFGMMIFQTLVYGFLSLIPLSIGVAISRSRLYDIDVLINRTLVYGSVTAALVLVYLGGVAAAQAVFRLLTGQEQQSQLAVVASTLVIAAMFNPLRRGIQAFIDRRFYRTKYDAKETLEAFAAKLRDETDLDRLGGELVSVVGGAMQPEHASLWLRPSDKGARR